MAVYREETVFPAAVVDEGGRLLGSVLMDRKAVQKSVEGGVLWCRHGDSDRILPWPGEPRLVSLKKEDGWYRAVTAAGDRTGGDAPGAGGVPAAGNSAAAEDSAAGGDVSSAGDASAAGGSPAGGSPAGGGDVLRSLAGIIRQRREEMPEGSYTTHLFAKGEEKIRKKTGEEAVELILARDPAELRYEAADLIYHLLVLLEETGVGLEAVLDELKGRE